MRADASYPIPLSNAPARDADDDADDDDDDDADDDADCGRLQRLQILPDASFLFHLLSVN